MNLEMTENTDNTNNNNRNENYINNNKKENGFSKILTSSILTRNVFVF